MELLRLLGSAASIKRLTRPRRLTSSSSARSVATVCPWEDFVDCMRQDMRLVRRHHARTGIYWNEAMTWNAGQRVMAIDGCKDTDAWNLPYLLISGISRVPFHDVPDAVFDLRSHVLLGKGRARR